MSYFTVCTPTYNRAHTIARPFESLMRQNFRDFEWLIVDDGSTDNTEEVVRSFIQKADFPIRYIKQENKGRAAALNEAYKHVQSPYIANMDSDDSFTDNALQILYNTWESIPEQEYDRFWCVTGHCLSNQTGQQIGSMWPEGINTRRGSAQHKVLTKFKGGEKYCCRKTEILKRFPFPQFDDTKFVPENILWEKINQHYDQYCINEVLRIYYTDSADGLSKSSHKRTTKNSYYHLSCFYLNECLPQITYNKNVLLAAFDVSRLAVLTGRSYKSVLRDLKGLFRKTLVSILWIPVWAATKIYYRKTELI